MHHGRQTETAGPDQDAQGREYKRAEHLDIEQKIAPHEVDGVRYLRHRGNQPTGGRSVRQLVVRLMHFVDQSAEMLLQADDRDPAVRLGEATHQSLQQPGSIGVQIVDTRHVELDARDRCALRHRAVDEMFQVSGVLGRPRTDRRQPQAVALGQAAKQGFVRQSRAHDLPAVVRRCRNAPLLLRRATNAAASHSSILSLAQFAEGIESNWMNCRTRPCVRSNGSVGSRYNSP